MNINELNELTTNINNKAAEIIGNLQQGQKLKSAELARMIGEQLGINGEDIMPLLSFFGHNYESVGIASGRNGGFYNKL